MDKAKKIGPITQSMNKSVEKLLSNFSSITEWTDINNWLLSLAAVLRDNPSPYINQKVLLSKRLNQCINPVVPEKVHEQVIAIHQIIFFNIRANSDNNINQYIKLFSEDLGIYSLSILPLFTHTSSTSHRLIILKMLNDYYLDLGLQLIPMLTGIMKCLLPVLNQTNDKFLKEEIQIFLSKLILKAGRRYVISTLWSCVLRFSDCRNAGIKILGKFISRMEFKKDQEQFESEHGFSEEEKQLEIEIQTEKKILEELGDKIEEIDQQLIQNSEHGSDEQIQIKKVELNDKIQDDLSKIKQLSEEDDLTDHKNSTLAKQQEENQYKKFDGGNSQRTMRLKTVSHGLNSILVQKQNNQNQQGHSIKLDKVPLMLNSGMEIIKAGINEQTNHNNFPHHSTLVCNSLIACLQDNSQFVKRATLDFMFTHLRLKSQVLGQNDKKLLVEAAIRQFRKMEVSVTKRVNRWLLGKQNSDNMYEINQKNQFVLPYIINAFQKILSDDPTIDRINSSTPLKTIQNFYMDHSHLIQRTISFISIDILRYVFNFSTGFDFSDEIVKAGYRFFSNIPSHYPAIFKSLGSIFIDAIKSKNDHLAFETVRYIDYCYIRLMKHDHGIQQLQYITSTLFSLAEGLRIFSEMHNTTNDFYQIYLRETNLLIYNLLSRRQSVEKHMIKQQIDENKKYLKQSGNSDLPPQRIQYQRKISEEAENEKVLFIEISDKLANFIFILGQIIRKTPNIQIYEEVFKLSTMSIVKIQNHLPQTHDIKQLPKWFSTIQYGIRVSSPAISLAAIEAMIKCLMYEQKHPIYASFKKLTMEETKIQTGNDFQNLALQKLWALLDYPHMHSKIIDLIVGFSKYFPNQFTETVKRSFTTHNDPEKEASIQRFSHFWRLTGFKYRDLLSQNKQFAQLNKVGLFKMLDFLDDQNPLVRHAAKNWMIQSMPLFYRVLQPLFFQLMKVSCDWYSTPKGLLIIRNNYDTNVIFSTFRRLRSLLANGTFGFLRYVYQQQISDRLEQLREKVTPINTSILTCQENKQEDLPMENPSLQREPVLPKALQYVHDPWKDKRMTYIDMLIILCVKYLQGIALESMGIDFYTGNSGVNTSAIELLESMISYIDNPNLCSKLINYIMEPLGKVLNQAVANQQFITQIQTLNLLKSIFFNSSFRKKGKSQEIRAFFKQVFTKPNFLSGILNGLNTPFAYVRSQFINFITQCIELIANFLDPEQCTNCIKHILFTYYKIIKQIRVSLLQEVLEQQDQSLEIVNEAEKNEPNLGFSRIVQLQLKTKQQEKFTKLSNNLQQVAKTNQILSILHGVSAILNYFYDLEKMDISTMKFEIINPYTIFDSFKSIITLGFASSQKLGRLVERTQFLHNMETAQSILQDLLPVYETILRAWPLSEQFVRIATEQFTSIGSRVFNFQKFSHYNKILLNLINFVNKQSENIWGKIFSILKPMFYRFPRDIMEIYLKLWIRQCTNPGQSKGVAPDLKEKLSIRPSVQNTEFLMKNLETIIVSNFPMNIIVHAFLQTSHIEQIKNYYINRKKDLKQSTLSYNISKIQAKLCYFLYVYFMYSFIEDKDLTKDKLLNIWSQILKAVRPFIGSNSPTTSLWVLDIINMCSVKYSPKQILTNEKFKTDLHGVVNQLLKQVAIVASKKTPLFYQDPTKFDINGLQEKYRVILPIPPSMFELYKTKSKQRSQIDRQLFISVRAGDVISIQKLNRLWCFKTLKKIGYQILQNTYLPQKAHFAVIRACQWMEIILPTIEDKSEQNKIYAESASQILFNLLQQARYLFLKPLRNTILRIFNKDDFFNCSKSVLIYWSKIIDWVVSADKNNETFSQYLSKVTISSSFFTRQISQNQRRVKSFARICFILYSGQEDKYAFKIKGLLEKIADVIKTAETIDSSLLILIVFSIRILILRLSQISLNQLFIDIWPMILAFLMQIFAKRLVKVQVSKQISKNPNLLLAALKLVQLISISNLGEFAHHQWIFIYDYFAAKIHLVQTSIELSQILSNRPQLTDLVSYCEAQNPSPFHYDPCMVNYHPRHCVQYKLEGQRVQKKNGYERVKREIIIKNSSVKSEQQLKCYAYLLGQYLARVDQFRMQIEKKQIEEVIINDFIKLESVVGHFG